MNEYLAKLRPESWPSPCFVTDLALLRKNAAVLDDIQQRTGAKIMLALKCFSQWMTFPVLSRAMRGPLYGCCASSPDEARLAKEDFCGEVHAFAAAWSEEELSETLRYADHIVFNSFAQWKRFAPMVKKAEEERGISIECGLRLNPEHSEGAVPIYDPCSPGSRLGIRPAAFHAELESIHPFQDGNGRVGRLVMFKECLRNGITPFIITDEVKLFYYRGLSQWSRERGYLLDTCRAAQDAFAGLLGRFRIEG